MSSQKSATTTKQPKHILKLTTQEKCDFLNSIDRIFTDIDGVVWNLGTEIVGAPQGFQALKNAGKPLQLITNNSVKKMEVFVEKFKEINLDVNVNELIHPADSIAYYLKSIKFEGLIYVVACERLKNILRTAGYQIIDGPQQPFGESYEDLAANVFTGEPVRAVVIDIDLNLSWAKLIRADIFLRHPDCILIAGATDMKLPASDNVDIIGPGPFLKILENTSNKRAITLGKPGKDLAELLLKRCNIKQPQRVLMIGDAMEQDIGLGKACGFQTLLVLSGTSSLNNLMTSKNADWIPDYYADSMADFVEFMNVVNDANKTK